MSLPYLCIYIVIKDALHNWIYIVAISMYWPFELDIVYVLIMLWIAMFFSTQWGCFHGNFENHKHDHFDIKKMVSRNNNRGRIPMGLWLQYQRGKVRGSMGRNWLMSHDPAITYL